MTQASAPAPRPGRAAFLKDVFLCFLGSYGGPEAHYGVFSSILVDKKKYLTEQELTEMIGLYSLVPGPSSTQTITAIGYHVGGPLLALLTFLVWALPAIIALTLIGLFFSQVSAHSGWQPMLRHLPAAAVAFILFAAFSLGRKVLKEKKNVLLYALMLALSLLLVGYSMWVVPALLMLGGLMALLPRLLGGDRLHSEPLAGGFRPDFRLLIAVIALALINEALRAAFHAPLLSLYTSFYRYGYSVIGGGQIVIPLMIQDLIETQSLLSLPDFLSGYAIDQAIPGPLFSFSAFVSARAIAGSPLAPLAGLIGGLSIFLPGILLVFFMFPLWRVLRRNAAVRLFLSGVTLTAAALIAMTAIRQVSALPREAVTYALTALFLALLLSKRVPAPLIVLGAAALGFVF